MSGPIIDMSSDGSFRTPPGPPAGSRLLQVAVLVAVLAGSLALAALALWVALLLVPVAIGAAFVAWLAWKWRAWRRHSAASGSAGRSPTASASNS